MEFKDFLKSKGSMPAAQDEIIYEFISQELANNLVKQGLWTKALADADWDEGRAKAQYVRMRFSQIEKQLFDEEQRFSELRSPDEVRRQAAGESAQRFGLSGEEIDYLDVPILAVDYLKKYKISKDKLALNCSTKTVKSVLSKGVLWVQDKEPKKFGWF